MKRFRLNAISFVAGLLVMAIILSAGMAFAATTRDISVIFRDIQLFVNGQLVTPRDAQGNVVEPFIFDGTTYLPVRAVGDALGLDVHWDAATSSVWLGDRPDRPFAEVPLHSRPHIDASNIGFVQIRGTDRENLIRLTASQLSDRDQITHITYALNGQARLFRATLHAEGRGIIRIYGDDRLLYETPQISRDSARRPVEINVEGVVSLRLAFEDTGNVSHGYFHNAIIVTSE